MLLAAGDWLGEKAATMKGVCPWQRGAVPVLGLILVLAISPVVHAFPPIFHPLEGRVGRCLTCHKGGGLGAPRVPPDHALYTNQICLSCHARPGGSFRQLYGTLIPFTLVLIVGVLRTLKRFGIRHLIDDLFRPKGTR